MDAQARQSPARPLRTQRIAALGTISDTAPLVSMVLYVATADFSAFYIHVSQLAQHTQALRQDRRVSLMIVEPDPGRRIRNCSPACRSAVTQWKRPPRQATTWT